MYNKYFMWWLGELQERKLNYILCSYILITIKKRNK